MATKKSNEAKVTAWTPTIKMEFNGTISACAIQLFELTQPTEKKTAAQMRETVLKLMQDRHEALKEQGL